MGFAVDVDVDVGGREREFVAHAYISMYGYIDIQKNANRNSQGQIDGQKHAAIYRCTVAMSICIFLYGYICILLYKLYIYIDIYIYIHTHTHIYIYIYMCFL